MLATRRHFNLVLLAALMALVVVAGIVRERTVITFNARPVEADFRWSIVDPAWFFYAAPPADAQSESTVDMGWFYRHTTKRDMHFDSHR